VWETSRKIILIKTMGKKEDEEEEKARRVGRIRKAKQFNQGTNSGERRQKRKAKAAVDTCVPKKNKGKTCPRKDDTSRRRKGK